MASYNALERLTMVMRHLNNKPNGLSVERIAMELDIPVPSIRKTIVTDYPECFEKIGYTRQYILSGSQPANGLVIDLTPEAKADNRVTKWPAEHFDKGAFLLGTGAPFKPIWNAIVKLAEMERKDVDMDGIYFPLLNALKAAVIILEVLRSADRGKSLAGKITNGSVQVDAIVNLGKGMEKK